MTTQRIEPSDPALSGTRLAVGPRLWLAVFLALLAWAVLRSLGPLAVGLGAWVLAAALPQGRERRAARGLLLLFGTLWIVHAARWVVYPVVAGLLAALLLAPLVAWLQARRVSRSLAAVLTLLPVGVLVMLAGLLLVPAITNQVQLLLVKLPDAYSFVAERSEPLMRLLGQTGSPHSVPPSGPVDSLGLAVPGVPGSPGSAIPLAGTTAPAGVDWVKQLTTHAESILRAAFGGISGVGRGLGKAAQYLAIFFLTPLVAFHLLRDRDSFRATALRWMPVRWHGHAARVAGDIASSLQVYLRGQFLVAAAEAVLFSVVFALAGLPQPVALGAIAGLLSLIPILGFWLTVVIVVLNAVTSPGTGAILLKAGIGIAIINFIEGQILVPKIQGSGLGLHPLVVFLGVLLFGTLFGFVGMLAAVPAMGVIRVTLPRLEEAWRRSAAYQGGDSQIDSPDVEE
jgi:predicted PurR-regulated permease PerM